MKLIKIIIIIILLIINVNFEVFSQVYDKYILPTLFSVPVNPLYPFINDTIFSGEELRIQLDENQCSIEILDPSLISFEGSDSLINLERNLFKLKFKVEEDLRESFFLGHFTTKSIIDKRLFIIVPEFNSTNLNSFDNKNNELFDSLLKYGDIFIPISINEDFRALHNSSGNKLSNILLNSDGIIRNKSFLNCFLLEILALIKFNRSNYDEIIVASRGNSGLAAIVIGSLINIKMIIVEDGYSVFFDQVRSITQFDNLWFNLGRRFSSSFLISNFSDTNTNFYFNFNCIYDLFPLNVDCNEKFTKKKFSGSSNFNVEYHLLSPYSSNLNWRIESWSEALKYINEN